MMTPKMWPECLWHDQCMCMCVRASGLVIQHDSLHWRDRIYANSNSNSNTHTYTYQALREYVGVGGFYHLLSPPPSSLFVTNIHTHADRHVLSPIDIGHTCAVFNDKLLFMNHEIKICYTLQWSVNNNHHNDAPFASIYNKRGRFNMLKLIQPFFYQFGKI